MTSDQVGTFCTSDDAVSTFLGRIFDPATEAVTIERSSRLWDAVESAHSAGRRGAGRIVGIVDTDFDLSIRRLASRIDPSVAAPPTRTAGHGTAVALLVSEVAPEATLQLFDVRPARYLHQRNVADAVSKAREAGCQLLNLSLGFTTSVTVESVAGVDAFDLVDVDHPGEDTTTIIDRYLETVSLFAADRCQRPCAVCDSLDASDASATLVAAGGNSDATLCPAAHRRCVGAGFEVVSRTAQGDNLALAAGLPDHDQSARCEFVLPLPAGFAATSFAAPLLTGVCALDDPGGDLEYMMRVSLVNSLIVMRHRSLEQLAEQRNATAAQGWAVNAAYRHLLSRVPPAHRHWDRPDDPPCSLCALTILDAYRGISQTFGSLGEHEKALAWAHVGRRICPLDPDVMMDHAVALISMSGAVGDADAVAALTRAADLYRAAASRRSEDSTLQRFCAEREHFVQARRRSVTNGRPAPE
ncbi:MAG: hypothetical protein SW127_20400 [Actinomycetota bacterium]|nr:hypothetical protein [Actinomycetota bacterium]